MLSPRRADTSELVWLPDPTKGDDDSFLPLSECIGKNTTDEARPSLDGKVLATEADKRHKSHMSAGFNQILLSPFLYFYLDFNIKETI